MSIRNVANAAEKQNLKFYLMNEFICNSHKNLVATYPEITALSSASYVILIVFHSHGFPV